MTHLAFTLIGGRNWTGGYNYLLNLVGLLATHGAARVTPLLFFGTDVADREVAPFLRIANAKVVRSPLMNQSRKTVSLARSVVLGVDGPVKALFTLNGVDVVFESAQYFGRRLGLPAIAWIPDFQHRRLQQLFTKRAFWRRELGFRAQVAGNRHIMLSSADAQADCHRYFPETRGRTHVVHFAVPAPKALQFEHARAVADSYGLPPRYFFMPNQFWQHKNHALVVDALALTRERAHDVVVAASGEQHDPRNPGHVSALLARISSLGLDRNLRLLGVVPYQHVSSLMMASQALLNPSRFEGWSTAVEEARSIGVPMLLSDIPVHREQAAGIATFFDPDSSASLADTLSAHRALDNETRSARAQRAAVESDVRVKRFVSDFIELVELVCRPSRRT